VHASALERAGIMGLAEGQSVAIDVAQGQKGPEAAIPWRRWPDTWGNAGCGSCCRQ